MLGLGRASLELGSLDLAIGASAWCVPRASCRRCVHVSDLALEGRAVGSILASACFMLTSMADHRSLSTRSRQSALTSNTGCSRISKRRSLRIATSSSFRMVRFGLSHPLNSHLAHTAALWRKACEPIAEWLARSFDRVSSVAPARAALAPSVAPLSRAKPEAEPLMTGIIPTLTPPLPTFITAAGGRRVSAPSVLKQRAGTKDEPVPAACWDCGRALRPEHRAFCSDDCADNYRWAMGKRRPVAEAVAPAVAGTTPRGNACQPASAGEIARVRPWRAAPLVHGGVTAAPFENGPDRDRPRHDYRAQLCLLHCRRHAHSAPSALSEPGGARRRRAAREVCCRAV